MLFRIPRLGLVAGVALLIACGDWQPSPMEPEISPLLTASFSSHGSQTFDAAADYTPGVNPNGAWSYGWRSTTSAFTLTTVNGTSGALDTWQPGAFYDRMVYYNTSTTTPAGGNCPPVDWCVQPGRLAMHPSNVAGFDVVVRFEAPQAADYEIDVTFSPIDAQSNLIEVWVLVNGAVVSNGNLTTFGSSFSYLGTHSLTAGGTIDFVVGNAGFWGNDGTDLDAVVTVLQPNQAPTISSIDVPLDPVAIGDQPITVSADFTDPDAGDTQTCTFDFGDGSAPVTVAATAGSCTADHTYGEAGVYDVTVTVTDEEGASDTQTAETMIVIYDPSGGFVTGGGQIDSPAGAYMADASLTGRATFGFNAKYKKGRTVPEGSTNFQFKAGDLHFHSSSYEFLVVNQNGTNAQFKGSGTINGSPSPTGADYKFMIWAQDHGEPGTDDTFRIKIWYEDGGEVVVYDNGVDQIIARGNIQIHTN